MVQDRNLLFGVLAVQLRKLTPVQLVDAAGAWAVDPVRSLRDRLVDSGALTARDASFIEDVVERALADHGGDPSATLSAFGGAAEIEQSFLGSVAWDGSGEVRHTEGALGHPAASAVDPALDGGRRYTVVREHSRGGMGRILLVKDDAIGRQVALKELIAGKPGADEASTQSWGGDSAEDMPAHLVDRFLQEARITGQLEHPSIVPVYEIGRRPNGALYYTMRFLRGRTLAQALRDAGSLADRLALLPRFVDLCQAIAFAHSQGVVHRDIKPANVIVGEYGETSVIDWGLAKARGTQDVTSGALLETVRMIRDGSIEAARTADGSVLGTPHYMSPEQALGQLDRVDARSDVYALGAVLHELLTGKYMYHGATVQEVLDQVIAGVRPGVLEIEPSAPRELAAICERAVSHDRDQRYQSARDLAQDVERFMQGRFVEAYRYGARDRTRRFMARNRANLLTAAAALLLAFALFVVTDVFLQRQAVRFEAARIAQSLETELATAAATLDVPAMDRAISSLRGDPRVLQACVYSPANEVQAPFHRAADAAWPGAAPAAPYSFQGPTLEVAWALQAQGMRLGTFYFVHDISGLAGRVRAQGYLLAGLGVFSAIFAVLVLAGSRGATGWRGSP